MAIDSLRKRASVASLGLAFLGPSVVPDGTLEQADRQTVANSFYGILAGSSFVEIGGTSQIGDYSSTGGITRERVLGATSQIGAYSATGGITLERTIGGTSQIGLFSSSGGIQVGDVVAPVVSDTVGGWWSGYDREMERREKERKRREKERKEAERIADELDRELAIAERDIEAEDARKAELARLNRLVAANLPIIREFNDTIAKSADEALEQQTFATMERLERQLSRFQEEEQFLIEATRIIINA